MDLGISFRTVVNNEVVPFDRRRLEFDGDDFRDVLVLGLSARSADLRWLERVLGLKARACRDITWPLLDEILEKIAGRRSGREEGGGEDGSEGPPKKKGRGLRVRPGIVVPVEVRERKILVANSMQSLQFVMECCDDGNPKGLSDLRWLLEQLREDLTTMHASMEKSSASGNAARFGPRLARSGSSKCDAVDDANGTLREILDDARQKILDKPGVTSAYWCPSRFSFKVVGLDGRERWLRVAKIAKLTDVVRDEDLPGLEANLEELVTSCEKLDALDEA